MVTERKYALTKIAAKDYLLPSNDASAIWRITTYEDGPSHGLEVDWPKDREFWGAWRWIGDLDAIDDDWFSIHGEWVQQVASCRTRAEAIAQALQWGSE